MQLSLLKTGNKMKRFLIIADDFTGANDAGVQLSRRGIKTHVIFDPNLILDDDSSYVLDTESRGLESGEAYKLLMQLFKNINFDKFDYIIKKTDSTLRGNIPTEVKALYDSLDKRTVIFAPAFPDIGRITIKGRHYFNDKPLMETEFAKDPVKPITTDCLKTLLMEAFDYECIHMNPDSLNANNNYTNPLYSFDCSTNSDLIKIVNTFENANVTPLWVGSAGICDAILNNLEPQLPSVALITSVSEATRKQVKFAEQKGVKIVQVPVHKLLQKQDYKYADDMISFINQGFDVLLISSATYDRNELDITVNEGLKLGLSRLELANLIQEIMSELMEIVLTKVTTSGLFLSGGDTAIGFIKRICSEGSLILGEVSNGIPIMQLQKGNFPNLKVITKAGGFGNEDAILYSLRKLKETSLNHN